LELLSRLIESIAPSSTPPTLLSLELSLSLSRFSIQQETAQ